MKAFILALLLISCHAEDIMTPTQLETTEHLEKSIQEKEAELDQLKIEWEKSVAEIGALTTQVDEMDHETWLNAMALATKTADAYVDKWHYTMGEWEDLVEEQREVYDQAIKQYDPLIPDGPWKTPLLLLAPLLFERTRKHAGKALKNAGTLHIVEAGKSLLKMIGALHSDEKERSNTK